MVSFEKFRLYKMMVVFYHGASFCVIWFCRREKSLEAYRSEITCVSRMRHEVVHLRALVSSQQDLITILTENNEKLRHEKFLIGNYFLKIYILQHHFC